MSYQDILSTLVLHGIIVNKRQLMKILRVCGLYSDLDDAINFKAKCAVPYRYFNTVVHMTKD